jgi:hypothetical protein
VSAALSSQSRVKGDVLTMAPPVRSTPSCWSALLTRVSPPSSRKKKPLLSS